MRLRDLLEDNKVTQEELASFVGVKRQSVSSWKDGKTVPDIESLSKMCQRFNVCADYLIGLSDDPSRTPSAVDILGLTPAATKTLAECYATDKTNSITLTVNALIENRFALGAISRYLYYDLGDGPVGPFKVMYRFTDKCSEDSRGIGVGDVKTPIDVPANYDLIDNAQYKRLLIIEVQEKLKELLDREASRTALLKGGKQDGRE